MQIQRLEKEKKKSFSMNAWNICKQSHLGETGPKLQEGIYLLEAQDKNTVYKLLTELWPSESKVISPSDFLCIVWGRQLKLI